MSDASKALEIYRLPLPGGIVCELHVPISISKADMESLYKQLETLRSLFRIQSGITVPEQKSDNSFDSDLESEESSESESEGLGSEESEESSESESEEEERPCKVAKPAKRKISSRRVVATSIGTIVERILRGAGKPLQYAEIKKLGAFEGDSKPVFNALYRLVEKGLAKKLDRGLFVHVDCIPKESTTKEEEKPPLPDIQPPKQVIITTPVECSSKSNGQKPLTKEEIAAQIAEINKKIADRSLEPKTNAATTIALLVGGVADVYREVRKKLFKNKNIDLKYHFEWKAQDIPKDVTLIIIVVDMINHNLENIVVEAAKRAGVPFVRTSRKWAVMSQAIEQQLP